MHASTVYKLKRNYSVKAYQKSKNPKVLYVFKRVKRKKKILFIFNATAEKLCISIFQLFVFSFLS